ncbi:hypothetical protein MY1884_006930 [Beauveria asiatica]
MQTYNRSDELDQTLHALLSEEIPSLLEVVVVWNNVDDEVPADYVSKHSVPVRYRQSPVNSLNQKLWPDPAYKTKAILLGDDDVYYHPSDVEFAFGAWREFGRDRMTSDEADMTNIRNYVDQQMNCEDIAMNHVTADGPGSTTSGGTQKVR